MKPRLIGLKIVFMLAAIAILLRLSYWQIVKASDLQSQASDQRVMSDKIEAERGEILGSDGFPLAANRTTYLLFANPTVTKAISGAQLDLLSQALSSSQSGEILNLLTQPDRLWVPIVNQLSPEVKDKITALQIAGLDFDPQSSRFYPEGTQSGQLLGFVGKDKNGAAKGYFGLEGYYDKQLSGVAGKRVREMDGLNRPIVIGSDNLVPPQAGRTLITSIDRTLQYIIFQKLTNALERYGAISGTVSVMDPATGQILAMVSSPGYDPADFGSFEPNLYKNPIVAEGYEPGSTFKVLVMAAALDAKVVTPETKCTTCTGSITVSGYPIRTWNDKYYPDSTMTEVIQHSDNVGMVFVSRKLEGDKLLTYLKKFGMGQLTGVDLQEESTAALRPINDWREIDWATASFGQGIAVTPLQMLRAVAAIANGGKMPTPQVVTAIQEGKSHRPLASKTSEKVISAEAAAQITQMMVNSVDQGEAKWAKPPGFVIAGKTGTAQIPVSGHYDQDKTIASFVGFAPAYNPKFVMLVTLREPQTSPWGSETAAPLWFDIAKDLLRYYQIPPSR